jgi:ribosomal protein S18 acetylase RimI-like enzyme
MTSIWIRPAVPEDAPALASVNVTTWRAAYRGIIAAEFLENLNETKLEERWRQRLTSGESATFVAVTDRGEVVGYVNAGIEREGLKPQSGEIYAVYLLPAYHRQGVGKRLMRRAMRWLKSQGMRACVVWVLEDNLPARQFYEALGGILYREQNITIGRQTLREVAYLWEDVDSVLNPG